MPNKNKPQKPSKPSKAAPAKKAPAKPVKAAAPAKKPAPAPVAKKHAAPAAKKHAAPAPAKKKHEAPKKAAPAKSAPHPVKHAAPAAKKHDKHEKQERHAKQEKHAPAKAAAAPAPAPKEAGKRRIVGAAPGSPAKDGKKAPHLKVVPAPAEEKKKAEVVVEVPAPKGVAILRGGKAAKKGKSESAAAALGKKRCREPGCDHELLLSGYCRLHYIKNWRKIKRKEAILASGQLNNYVEELVNKYPDKYLDVIRQDLASEKDWAKVVIDLELESADEESAGDDDLDSTTEGVGRSSGRGADFDDDSDTF